MGHPQANQQTQFLGYPQNQLYNQADQQFMLNAQRGFADEGPYQSWMTRPQQWVQSTDPVVMGAQGQALHDYFQRVGTPYEQSQRQGYWEQMGGQVYGGVIPRPRNPITGVEENPAYSTPWGDLNNMGISTAYGMPAWQQDYFNSQNATPGGGQDPMEQFNLANSGSTSLSDYGIPASFNPAEQATAPNPMQTTPGYGDPRTPSPMQPATPEWMYPQQQNSWGNNSSNPWGGTGGWGGRGWGR